MVGVKYLAECFSKKTQKSALGRNYYQILMHKNQILCSIVWNYVHKKHAFKCFRHRKTIFNHNERDSNTKVRHMPIEFQLVVNSYS